MKNLTVITPEQRRKFLRSTLSRQLKTYQLIQALTLWDREFADRSEFALSAFVHRFSQQLELDEQVRQKIMKELSRGLLNEN